MDFTVADMDGDEAIAAYACDMVVQKKADIPMEGIISTASFMRAILNKERGFVPANALISQSTLFEWQGRFMILTDCAINIAPDYDDKIKIIKNAAALAKKAGIRVYTANEGDTFRIGEGKISVLSPKAGASGENVNEDAVVFLLSYKNFRGLFTGDVGEETEKKLLRILQDVDFMKVGHHGSGYSSSQAFLDEIKPEVSLISCSESNTYGHPSPEAVKRLESAGSRVEYTMKSGAVTVFTEGNRIGIRRFSPS